MSETNLASEVLSSDDIAFLVALANELKTQDRGGTAKPVIYQIQEHKKEWGYEEDWADGMDLFIGEQGEFFDDDVAGAKQFLVENYAVDGAMLANAETLKDVADICADRDIPATYTGYLDAETYKGFFLTQAALKQHIASNGHHYKNPVSCAQFGGFRNPELERLLAIVEKFASVTDPQQ